MTVLVCGPGRPDIFVVPLFTAGPQPLQKPPVTHRIVRCTELSRPLYSSAGEAGWNVDSDDRTLERRSKKWHNRAISFGDCRPSCAASAKERELHRSGRQGARRIDDGSSACPRADAGRVLQGAGRVVFVAPARARRRSHRVLPGEPPLPVRAARRVSASDRRGAAAGVSSGASARQRGLRTARPPAKRRRLLPLHVRLLLGQLRPPLRRRRLLPLPRGVRLRLAEPIGGRGVRRSLRASCRRSSSASWTSSPTSATARRWPRRPK